jgi:hypothetical protein
MDFIESIRNYINKYYSFTKLLSHLLYFDHYIVSHKSAFLKGCGTVTNILQHKIGKYKKGTTFIENDEKRFCYENKQIFTESTTNL